MRAVRVEREVLDAALALPVFQAAAQVVLQPDGGLVALLGRLGEQLHDDARNRRRYGFLPRARRHRHLGDVAVYPLHRVRGGERQRAGQHLVERDAERVEVAARIDRPVHPPGLLGCHVGQRAGDGLGRLGRLALARQARGQAEAGEPCLPVGAVHDDMGRLQVLVKQPALVEPA
ncbi:hypothetical protein D3C86_1194370 [compost metagenome]